MVEPESFYFAVFFLTCAERFRIVPAGAMLLKQAFGAWRVSRPVTYPSNGSWGWCWIGATPLSGLVFLLQPCDSGGAQSREEIRRRIATIERDIARLRTASAALAIWLVIGMPAVIYWLDPRPALLPVLLAFLALDLTVAGLAWSARKRSSLRSAKLDKWSCLRYAVYPPAAMMAPAEVSWSLLSGMPAVSVVMAVCGKATPPELIREEWVRLAFSGDPSQDEAAIRALRASSEDAGLDWAAITGPPRLREPKAQSYCPRCRSQYLFAAGDCADCPGIRTTLFEHRQGEG